MAALGLGPKKVTQPAMRGANFSSVASRPTSTPIFTASYSSSIPTTRAPDMNRNNFPSLGGGPKPFVPTSYGGASSSRASPNLAGVTFHLWGVQEELNFPAPPAAAKKKGSVSSAFAPKKPLQWTTYYNFLRPQLQKDLLISRGPEHSFASGSKEPERYVDEAVSLFDRGVTDKAFWEHVPCLIESCPNKSGVNRAMNHLESLRMANQMQEMEFGGGGGSAPKKPINYVLPAKKKTNSWGGQTAKASASNTPVASLEAKPKHLHQITRPKLVEVTAKRAKTRRKTTS
ncbi:hypothetical protein QTG54_008368 [Skeletonema marinoi]|uniref:Uncharacterized protein n=1 Tax=Skeletonema marinoi TaxID=267567 RepID=A0AAD9DB77_9STRA|nr:hypothetical protein QTG54_008368 [Skeletonema marinoi]